MSSNRLIIKLILVFVLPLFAFKKDKCNTDALYVTAMKKLGKFSYLKDYRIYMKKNKNLKPDDYEYYIVPLNRGTKYKFMALSNGDMDGKLVINLYNSPKKEFVFATTLSQKTLEVKESIEFKCETTGNFCVGYYFLDGKEGCGVAITAFQQD